MSDSKKKQSQNKDSNLWQQDGKFMILVKYGATREGRYIVKADTFALAVQKIVNDIVAEWHDAYDADSEITFCRETYDELK